jgi:hypothetical protein
MGSLGIKLRITKAHHAERDDYTGGVGSLDRRLMAATRYRVAWRLREFFLPGIRGGVLGGRIGAWYSARRT